MFPLCLELVLRLLRIYIAQIRQNSIISCIGYVFDTGVGAIRVRYAHDTLVGVSEYPDNSDTSRYVPIRSDTPSIRPDTPLIRPRYVHGIFFKVFWWIRSRICPWYSSICPDSSLILLRYFSNTSLSEIYIMFFILL
jgi:hypothetical protein